MVSTRIRKYSGLAADIHSSEVRILFVFDPVKVQMGGQLHFMLDHIP